MNDVIACRVCGLVQQAEDPPEGYQRECARCGEMLSRVSSSSRMRTAALALAALFLYVPANIYPIIIMEYMGRHTENTVWQGVQALYQDRMWYVAIIVFVASILFPLLKLLGLFFLVLTRGDRWQKPRTRVYKIICQIGSVGRCSRCFFAFHPRRFDAFRPVCHCHSRGPVSMPSRRLSC